MKTFTLEQSTVLPYSRERVFDFFSRAENLESLTPPWLSFRILTPLPIHMCEGALIDYRLSLRGIPLTWRSEITVWDPPNRFVDEQRRGPYRMWIHEHRFEEVEGGTRVSDHVTYAVLGGALVRRFFVLPDLERIFKFRQESLPGLIEESLLAAGPKTRAPGSALRPGPSVQESHSAAGSGLAAGNFG